MNAAAKVIAQSQIFQGDVSALRLSAPLSMVLFLVLLLFLSALSVVYVTNLNRTTHSQLEQAQHQAHELHLQWGNLLLEQASLATPSRVQRLSEAKLHMHLPRKKITIYLRGR